MKKNTSNTDRIIRIIFGTVLAFLNLSGITHLPESVLLWVMIVILSLTAFSGNCPMYKLFGINTRGKRKYEIKD
ncbi:MAG: DUF2892 domain-containing protein [Ferruginibacter sp.]|nr:DUF2892 domain-containing protein [Ferruginibacter sp.]